MFRISAEAEYALMLVKYLLAKVREGNTTPISIRAIAAQTGASEAMLRRIVPRLETAKIVASHAGRLGGVELLRLELSLSDVFLAVGEDTGVALCAATHSGGKVCAHAGECGVSSDVVRLQRGIDTLLKLHKL